MIHVGDCLEVMRTLEANSVDSIVTDPPYHLTTGKKGGTGVASVNLQSPYGRARIGTGFMGKTWDGGDVAFRPETWAEALRVAKPGAFMAAFGGTRTFHRLACAIEDAGWDLRDTLMWMYGSGFPKSHNGEWGGTALKPAWEPIVLARKPLAGTVESNWRKNGTGALNIDGCRVNGRKDVPASPARKSGGNALSGSVDGSLRRSTGTEGGFDPNIGRWPANLLHDGSDEVVDLFPSAPGQQRAVGPEHGAKDSVNTYGNFGARDDFQPRSDSGSAARFFYCAKADRTDRNEGCESLPTRLFGMSGAAAAARGEHYDNGDGGVNRVTERQNHHPTVKPTDLMRWLCRLVTPPGGHVLDPFCGSGSTGRGAVAEGMQFTGIELDPDYARIAEARIRAIQPGLALA